VHGDRRSNAACKHSQWVSDRVPIEQHAREVEAALDTTFQEVILSEAVVDDAGVVTDRLLLEGTVSNFFVGTVRFVLLLPGLSTTCRGCDEVDADLAG
jgi:hypothetical protein